MVKKGRPVKSYKEVYNSDIHLRILSLLSQSEKPLPFKVLKYVFCKNHDFMNDKDKQESEKILEDLGYKIITDKRDNKKLSELDIEEDGYRKYDENFKSKKFNSSQALWNALNRIGDKGLKIISNKNGSYQITDFGLSELYQLFIYETIEEFSIKYNYDYKKKVKKLKELRRVILDYLRLFQKV